MSKPVICHISTVHPRYDSRVFHKELVSIARAGYDTNFIVADGKGDEQVNGVKIWDIGKPTGRVQRLLFYGKKALKKALEIDADLYHFHDPELIPVGIKLKKKGKKVIYDSHEDVPKQVFHKTYIPRLAKSVLYFFMKVYEKSRCRKFDFVITAEPFNAQKFKSYGINTIEVRNYPDLKEFNVNGINKNPGLVAYVGGLTPPRGVREMVKAMEYVDGDVKLVLAGKFAPESFRHDIEQMRGWEKVDYRGYLNRQEIADLLNEAIAGLVVIHPTPKYKEAIAIKMFEYMAAKAVVIASDFPFWKELLKETDCAIFVDPLNPKEIANAIEYLIKNPDIAQKMGENGRKAVIEKFNWSEEEKKLLDLYKTLLISD